MIAANEKAFATARWWSARRDADQRRLRPVLKPAKSHELRTGRADGATVARAITAEDLLLAYRFVHDVTAGQGLVEPSPRGLRMNHYQAVPEMAVFLVRAGADVLAVQGAIPDSTDLGLPSDRPFFIEIDQRRRDGRFLCEATMPACSVMFQKSIMPDELMRCSVAYANMIGCDELVTAVEPWQANQYAGMGFKTISPVREFSSDVPFPAVLMGLDLDALRNPAGLSCRCKGPELAGLRGHFVSDNPYRRHVTQWAVLADEAFDDPDFLQEMFVLRSDVLADCDDAQLAAIRRRWGKRAFDAIWPVEVMPIRRASFGQKPATQRPAQFPDESPVQSSNDAVRAGQYGGRSAVGAGV